MDSTYYIIIILFKNLYKCCNKQTQINSNICKFIFTWGPGHKIMIHIEF